MWIKLETKTPGKRPRTLFAIKKSEKMSYLVIPEKYSNFTNVEFYKDKKLIGFKFCNQSNFKIRKVSKMSKSLQVKIPDEISDFYKTGVTNIDVYQKDDMMIFEV